MGQSVTANGRSILHKGHGMTHVCAVPDVCKTPSPGGPIPIPYVNLAMDSDLTDGAESVQIEGNPVATISSKISTSSGDEPGSIGGIASSKFKGIAGWTFGSLDTKAEGHSLVRFNDPILHNGNSYNTAFMNMGGVSPAAYGDDFKGPCKICRQMPDKHRILDKKESNSKCLEILKIIREKAKTQENKLADLLEEKKTANKARRTEIAAEQKQLDLKEYRKAYMIGVMYCKNCDQYFAAMSGPNFFESFRVAAKNAGCVPIRSEPGKHVVDLKEILSANEPSKNNIKLMEKLEKTLYRESNRIDIEKRPELQVKYGYTKIGNCAGTKLIAHGHIPASMTEMYYSGPEIEAGNFTYNILETIMTPLNKKRSKKKIIRNKYALRSTERKSAVMEKGTVLSCPTCQTIIRLMMCPQRTCPDPKKAESQPTDSAS